MNVEVGGSVGSIIGGRVGLGALVIVSIRSIESVVGGLEPRAPRKGSEEVSIG